MKKILVVGSRGSLGREIVEQFSNEKIEVLELHRGNFDLNQDEESIYRYIKDINIDILINCIALTGLERCFINRKEAYSINFTVPKLMAKICENLDIKMIQFSTDNIFSCDVVDRLYTEIDEPSPITWYGVTKYLGEYAALKNGANIIRLPMLFGPTNEGQIMGKLFAKLMAGEQIFVSDDVYTTPVYTPNVVDWLLRKFVYQKDELPPIIHLSSNRKVSLYNFTLDISDLIKTKGIVTRVTSDHFPALENKSRYGGLSSLIESPFDYQEAVKKYAIYLGGIK